MNSTVFSGAQTRLNICPCLTEKNKKKTSCTHKILWVAIMCVKMGSLVQPYFLTASPSAGAGRSLSHLVPPPNLEEKLPFPQRNGFFLGPVPPLDQVCVGLAMMFLHSDATKLTG